MQEIGEKVLSVRFFLLLFLKFLVIKQSFALALNFITSVTRIRLHGTLLHIGRINYIFAMENGEVYALTLRCAKTSLWKFGQLSRKYNNRGE